VKTALTVVVAALIAASVASGYVRAYAIDPVRADWSGKADPEDGIGQVITVNFDQLDSTSGYWGHLPFFLP